MNHNIRINGEVKTVDCELGNGIFDLNGREIFEGDLIKNPLFNLADPFDTPRYVVTFDTEQGSVFGHKKSKFKDTGLSWSPRLHYAYNRLLDACIARKSPETVCEAALTVVQAAKDDNRFDE